MIKSQLELLADQNNKVGEQISLLTEQNEKIDQQTAVADAQKRGAFVTEMFSILQEVAKANPLNGEIPKELVTRIAVLTTSAVPYSYINQRDPYKRSITLSPERGQLILALLRLNVKLSPLIAGGSRFDSSDLRGFDLTGADLSDAILIGSDLSFAELEKAKFLRADLTAAVMTNVRAGRTDFTGANLRGAELTDCLCFSPIFNQAVLEEAKFKYGTLSNSSFVGAEVQKLTFDAVKLGRSKALPNGLSWPEEVLDAFKEPTPKREFLLTHQF